MSWISIAEYAKKKGLKSPQVVYNRIAFGKIKKEDVREVEITVKRKQIKWSK